MRCKDSWHCGRYLFLCFFFFQAEDGIRDADVTGVQTCALPILVHGDLSAYNLLYWEGKLTLIDFPQGTSSHANQSAHVILHRDVQRVCEYFARRSEERRVGKECRSRGWPGQGDRRRSVGCRDSR